jgi:adenylate kinase
MKKSLQSPSNKVFNIILLGDPASGKGTQSERLAKEYDLYDLDMGREIRKPASQRKFDYKNTTARGKLTPTAVVRDIFTDVIAKVPAQQGILFNGTPKMINEARLVKKLLTQHKRTDPIVIYISIPTKEIIERMEKRTEFVNGKLVRRDDDTIQALKNRRKYYKDQVSKVVIFFKKNYTLKTVSGMGTEREVSKRIEAIIKKI